MASLPAPAAAVGWAPEELQAQIKAKQSVVAARPSEVRIVLDSLAGTAKFHFAALESIIRMISVVVNYNTQNQPARPKSVRFGHRGLDGRGRCLGCGRVRPDARNDIPDDFSRLIEGCVRLFFGVEFFDRFERG